MKPYQRISYNFLKKFLKNIFSLYDVDIQRFIVNKTTANVYLLENKIVYMMQPNFKNQGLSKLTLPQCNVCQDEGDLFYCYIITCLFHNRS